MADRSVDGCLCIRLLTDLDLFTVCTLVSIVHYPLAEAKLNAEKGQKIQDQRKPLCQSSAGEGRKATWSCCAWVCCDHESCSHHPNMTNTCVLPKHRHTVMRQLSVLTGTGLFPLFSSSSAFLLFHIIDVKVHLPQHSWLPGNTEPCRIRGSRLLILQTLIGSFSASWTTV